METKITAISIFAAAILIGGIIIFIGWDSNLSDTASSQTINNVSMLDGKQIITINAKGGYFPKTTNAKAGIATAIKVDTQGTFDCSSAITIPALGYRNNLPPSGETLIDVPPQNAGTTLRGLCSMGMYSFAITFN